MTPRFRGFWVKVAMETGPIGHLETVRAGFKLV